MITREVTWKDPRFGTRVKGKIIDTHGSRCYRARFRLGLPGWALGDKAEVQQAPG